MFNYLNFFVMDYEEIKPVKVKICTLDEMPNFESLACVCGLSFPETANEFQTKYR